MPTYSPFPDEGSPASDTHQWQTRIASPAPTISAKPGTPGPPSALKRPFMSKLFGRKKSRSSLQNTSTAQTVVPDNDELSLGPSRSATPAPLIRRTTSPFNDLSNVQAIHRETLPPLPQMSPDWIPFSASPQPGRHTSREGAQTSLSTYTGAYKKPKSKRSFSALTNLFKPSNAQSPSTSEILGTKPETRRKRRGTMKSTFSSARRVRVSSRSSSFGTLYMPENDSEGMNPSSRTRASTMLSMPLPSPSMAMLFDASQAEAHATSGDSMGGSPVRYTPLKMPAGLSPIDTKVQTGPSQSGSSMLHGLSKSKSSPDLFSFAKNQSYPSSPTLPSPVQSRAPSRAAGGEPSPLPSRLSLAGHSRSPSSKMKGPNSTMLPRSPMSLKMPSNLPGLLPSPGRSTFATESERSRSPAPSAYAMSTISKKPNKTFLDQILDVDLGSVAISSETQPWSFGLDSDDEQEAEEDARSSPKRVAGLSVKVAKELRPNTAGTFGRPQTGTGKHKPAHLKFDGRLRRLSTVSASEDNHNMVESDIEPSLPSAATQDSSLSFNLDKFDISSASGAQAQNDSGFDELNASQHLNLSAVGQAQSRRLSTGLPTSPAPRKGKRREDFRPTTADTTHLPLDLPDIDIAFDPKSSLGSLGRQSSVSTLSDDEDKRKVNNAAEVRLSLLSNKESIFTPSLGPPATDPDLTPRKPVLTQSPTWAVRTSLEAEGIKQTSSSVSSSVMSRILSRKHLEESMFASRYEGAAEPNAKVSGPGIYSEPPTPAIVMTFADADDGLVSTPLAAPRSQGSRLSSELAAAENARINDPFDPYGNSYFPPVKSMVPVSPFPSSGTVSGPPSVAGTGTNGDTDVVKRLLEQLEAETTRREALEYSLASLRESTGADLRRSDQKIKEMMEENKRLLSKLARLASLEA
ncbi:hypothetical protein P389DRAFT_53338 [Cystobasidium minutum MCA 4210]|uniref:uncharacterized protein n=1 Tax=Cystobasidium minutum MCA 4210 TaxID=1397322 RepID=UPI0034CDD32A|eukprot:jgi/Rhomi1/53338/CE53337_205